MFKFKASLVCAGLALAAISAPTQAQPMPPGVVYSQVAPPPVRVERVPTARRGYVWVPGYWAWRGHRHVWVSGTWVKERRGYRYEAPAWVQEGNRWVWRPGVWVR